MRTIRTGFPTMLLAATLTCLTVAPTAFPSDRSAPVIADHTTASLALLAPDVVEHAKETLHIAYGHTSHGSQLVTGMTGLVQFAGDVYAFRSGGGDGYLDLRDTPFSGANDLGNPNRTSWAAATRTYLDAHSEVNVIIWSWCGQAGTASEADITTYLDLMNALETDYPTVIFVYMTGHLDGSGADGNLNLRNEQIRAFCRDNNKVLFDFADIESYDPDGVPYMEKFANDNCDYDSDGNGSRDSNWATAWQSAHPGEWYNCSAAHSQPLNANLKAYAVWHLWSELAEELSPTEVDSKTKAPIGITVSAGYPNPFNGSAAVDVIQYTAAPLHLLVYSLSGQLAATLSRGERFTGTRTYLWDGRDDGGHEVSSGTYLYRCVAGESVIVRKVMYII